MKKLCFLVLTLTLLLVLSATVFADVDLAAMTLDELIALRQQVDEAIAYHLDESALSSICVYQNADGTYSFYILQPDIMPTEVEAKIPEVPGVKVPGGKYHVGIDLDPGSYTFTLTGSSYDDIMVEDSEGNRKEDIYLNRGDTVRLTLIEGDTLILESECAVQKAGKISFD